jgi:hypothetical protein
MINGINVTAEVETQGPESKYWDKKDFDFSLKGTEYVIVSTTGFKMRILMKDLNKVTNFLKDL